MDEFIEYLYVTGQLDENFRLKEDNNNLENNNDEEQKDELDYSGRSR